MNKKGDNQKNQRIQVFVRCRPLNSIERKQCSASVVEVFPEKREIVLKDKNSSNRDFYFDKVFSPDTKQIAVYKSVVAPLIQEVLSGYNCTVFAYGQTGTGKTYTMEGERNNTKCSWEDDPAAGIIPRSLHQLFEELNKEENVEFSVRVSFLELYNEEIFDLLSSTELSKLRLYEDNNRKGSVIIQGLEEIPVNNKDEVYTILEKGTARRQTAATMLNATSSRSHTVFSVTVHIKENTVEGEELLKTGKLNLVDLAGSENVGRSGAIDKRAREAGNINQSLLTLGRVITALIEKQPHVPYRESKLTRLLQDSLGGHTKTSIIATISPAQCNYDETMSTLDYASKAKNITIKPEANQKTTKRALIKDYDEKIERLQKELVAARGNQGYFIDADQHTSLLTDISAKAMRIKDLLEEIELLTAEKGKVEEMFALSEEKLSTTCEQLNEKTQRLEETEGALNYTQEALSKRTLERDEKDYLIGIQKNTEKKLSHQGQTLLQVADQATEDLSKLHAKLDRKQNVEKTNEEQCTEFRIISQKKSVQLYDMITEDSKEKLQFLQVLKEDQDKIQDGLCKYKQKTTSLHDTLNNELKSLLNSFSAHLNKEGTSERQWASDLLQSMNSEKDKLILEQHRFLTERLPFLLNQLNAESTSMEDWVLNIHNRLNEKLSHHKLAVEAQIHQQKSLLGTLRSSLASFYTSHDDVMHNFKRQIQSLSESKQKLDKILISLSGVRDEIEKTVQIEDTYSKFENNVTRLRTVEEPLSLLDSNVKIIEDEVTETSNILDEMNLDEFSLIKESALKSHEAASLEVTNILEHSQRIQIENYHKHKTEFECHDSTLLKNLQNNESTVKNIITSLSNRIEEGKCLEEHYGLIRNIVAHSTDKVAEFEITQIQSSSQFKEEILKRDLEIEKFISEDLVKDIPTGTTPQRKTYLYPKLLSATSPHDRILQRYRAQLALDTAAALNLPLDLSFDEKEEFKDTTEDICSTVNSQNASFASDVYESDGCETDSSTVSDVSVESRNKENCKKSKSASRLPKPKSLKTFKGFVRPAPISGRKPLVSPNPDTNSTY